VAPLPQDWTLRYAGVTPAPRPPPNPLLAAAALGTLGTALAAHAAARHAALHAALAEADAPESPPSSPGAPP